MVHIDRVYTRSGDSGETSLADGSRVRKSSVRIAAIGAVDETNSAIGLALAGEVSTTDRERLTRIQNDLFDLGADVATPVSEEDPPHALRIVPTQVDRLEGWIDDVTSRLEPLDSFVLPGGSPAAAALHLARAVCRRAEAACVALSEAEAVSASALAYVNRLSDLLFVLARAANDDGRDDVKWVPGANRGA